jgi:hypothetical protein
MRKVVRQIVVERHAEIFRNYSETHSLIKLLVKEKTQFKCLTNEHIIMKSLQAVHHVKFHNRSSVDKAFCLV